VNRKERRARGTAGGAGGGNTAAAALKLAREMARRGNTAEAGLMYRQILQANPNNVAALLDLGIGAVERMDIEGAAPLLAKAAALDPKNPWALVGLAIVRLEQSNMEEALKLAEKTARLDCPPQVLTKLGILYKETGHLDRARQCLRKALIKKPDHVVAWYNLQDLKKFAPGDTDIAKLEEIAAKANTLPPHEQVDLHFTMGKAFLDTGDTDKAFAHIAEGNRLKRSSIVNYDIGFFEEYIGNVIKHFDETAVKRLRNKVTVRSDRPVFIVGMFRSGSTLADQIISSHPDATSVGEAKFFQYGIPVVPNTEMREGYFNETTPSVSKTFMEQLTGEALDGVAQKYLAATDPFAKGAKRVVDKMLFNYIWVGLMRLAFPEGRVIRCLRDPADICLSIWRTNFAAPIPWAYDQKEIARYYLGYERLMQHWHRILPGEIYDLNYEAVVADQEGETRKLLDFCGLPFDDRCLNFHKTERRVSTASDVQVRQPIYKDSVKKWKKYEKYLAPLLDTLGVK
jgi:hypothetical protein